MLELNSGDLIADRFRVEALLGEGGIARVYRVRHVRLGSVHAVKILMLPRPALADRLLLEGRIQAQLRHPNLVRVTDVVEHEAKPVLVMEYVNGTHLQALLAESGPLPVRGALELFSGVLSAVAAAHDQGVLHRDLKPANILLEQTRRGLVPKVSDFGIAKVASEGLREGQTRVGVQMGTPGYMAPEQVEDSAQVDHRADIFALGAILYEMLTGARPFQEDTTFRTMQATLSGQYPPVLERRPDCPPAVARTIEVALAVPMEERFPDCHAMANALFAEQPELRGRIERTVAVALPEGLHRPEITQATTPSASTPTGGALSQPTIVAPEALLPDAARPAATPAPAPYRGSGATGPQQIGSIGVNTGADAPASAMAASLSPMRGEDEAAGRAAISIGGSDSDSLDELDAAPPRRTGVLPFLVAATLVVGLGIGGWAWYQGHDADSIETEQLDARPEALGQAVPTPEPPDAEPPAEDKPTPAQVRAEPAPAQVRAEPAPAQAPVEPAAVEPAAVEPAAVEPAAVEPAADAASEDQARPATEAGASTARQAEPSADAPSADPPTAADSATGQPATAEPAAEPPADAEQPPAGDALADAATADAATAATPAVQAPLPEQPAARPPPALQGTWKGLANDNPLTIRITSQDGDRVVGELSFTQGAIQRVARVTGTVDATSNRLTLSEEGGAGLRFSGVVRGTGMMGTYGRQGKASSLSWSATRQ